MALQRVTEEVIKLVEAASNLPVAVSADPTLGTFAKVRIAPPSGPAHILTYNPTLGPNVDYAIVSQCGFVLRIYQAPPAERYDLATNYRGRREIEKAVNDLAQTTDRLKLNREGRLDMAQRFYLGLTQQLRSIPVGLRVDDWIRQSYPALAEQQKAVISRQLNDNAAVLAPDIHALTPASVYEAIVKMNAAFAAFWAKVWGDPLLTAPYKATGHLAAGEALLALWEATPADPAHDKKLIDLWGEQLGLKGWYDLLPRPTG